MSERKYISMKDALESAAATVRMYPGTFRRLGTKDPAKLATMFEAEAKKHVTPTGGSDAGIRDE